MKLFNPVPLSVIRQQREATKLAEEEKDLLLSELLFKSAADNMRLESLEEENSGLLVKAATDGMRINQLEDESAATLIKVAMMEGMLNELNVQ